MLLHNPSIAFGLNLPTAAFLKHFPKYVVNKKSTGFLIFHLWTRLEIY